MDKNTQTEAQQKKKALFFQPTNGYDRLAEGEEALIQAYCQGYKTFLDEGKTERECVSYAISWRRPPGSGPWSGERSSSPGTRCTGTTGASP